MLPASLETYDVHLRLRLRHAIVPLPTGSAVLLRVPGAGRLLGTFVQYQYCEGASTVSFHFVLGVPPLTTQMLPWLSSATTFAGKNPLENNNVRVALLDYCPTLL
jgi:hypothetical protein